jgi:hypothetical protein
MRYLQMLVAMAICGVMMQGCFAALPAQAADLDKQIADINQQILKLQNQLKVAQKIGSAFMFIRPALEKELQHLQKVYQQPASAKERAGLKQKIDDLSKKLEPLKSKKEKDIEKQLQDLNNKLALLQPAQAGIDAFMKACEQGLESDVQKYLAMPNFNINVQRPSDGATGLMLAAIDFKCVRSGAALQKIDHLLAKGANPDIKDKKGKTALEYAIDVLEKVAAWKVEGARMPSPDVRRIAFTNNAIIIINRLLGGTLSAAPRAASIDWPAVDAACAYAKNAAEKAKSMAGYGKIIEYLSGKMISMTLPYGYFHPGEEPRMFDTPVPLQVTWKLPGRTAEEALIEKEDALIDKLLTDTSLDALLANIKAALDSTPIDKVKLGAAVKTAFESVEKKIPQELGMQLKPFKPLAEQAREKFNIKLSSYLTNYLSKIIDVLTSEVSASPLIPSAMPSPTSSPSVADIDEEKALINKFLEESALINKLLTDTSLDALLADISAAVNSTPTNATVLGIALTTAFKNVLSIPQRLGVQLKPFRPLADQASEKFNIKLSNLSKIIDALTEDEIAAQQKQA